MQGKIAVEEHFAIAETAANVGALSARSLLGGDRRQAHRSFRSAPCRNGCRPASSLRVLSLNANGIQDIPEAAKAVETGARGQRCFGGRGRQAARSLCGARRAADAGPARRRRRAAALRARSEIQEARWSTAFPKSAPPIPRSITTCRNTGRSGPRLNASMRRFICIRAISLPSRRQRYEGHPWLVGSPWDFAEETAIHALAPDGLRTVRRISKTADRYRASRRAHSVTICGGSITG